MVTVQVLSNRRLDIPDELRRQLDNCTSLVSLAAIALEVIRMGEDPDIGLLELESAIRNDVAIKRQARSSGKFTAVFP